MSRMTTVADSIADILRPIVNPRERELAILRELPEDAPAPLLSNCAGDYNTTHGWVSWSSPAYDPDNVYDPVAIARAIESAGWTLQPATLVQWDNCQPQPYPALCGDIPDTRGSYKFSNSWPIAPFWVELADSNPHNPPEVLFFMRSRAGLTLRVSIDIRVAACVYARRAEFNGGWRYQQGSARLRIPESWESMDNAALARHAKSYCCRYGDSFNPQGLRGAVYWEMNNADQSDFSMSVSRIVSMLVG